MKYYLNTLWKGINSDIKEEREKADLQWKKNDEEYTKVFDKVKNKLPKKFLKIYMKEYGFHDYHIKDFEIINEKSGYKDPVTVKIIITNGINTWDITYKKIKKIVVNYEQEPDLFPGMGRRFYGGFDDYGFDEFFEIDDKVLSQEILFASDATILIHFEKISIKKETDKEQEVMASMKPTKKA